MFTVRIAHYPAPGKATEMRAALEEHSKAMNAAGSPHNLTQLLYASEPTFVNSIRHESLAALEAYGPAHANDDAYRARTAKFLALDVRPTNSELYENLVATPVTGEINYTLRSTYEPALGKVAELRQALEKIVNTPTAGAVMKSLSAQVAPPDGVNFTVSVLFSSLAGLEEYRNAARTDPNRGVVANLVARHARNALYRQLLRFNET